MALQGCSASFLLGNNAVAELTSISNAISGDSLDTTTFDSACIRSFVAGLRSGTIDIAGYYDPTDTSGQAAMLTAMLAGTLLTDTQLPKILWNGAYGISANGIITSLNVDAAVEGLVGFSATIQLSGTISVLAS